MFLESAEGWCNAQHQFRDIINPASCGRQLRIFMTCLAKLLPEVLANQAKKVLAVGSLFPRYHCPKK